MIAAPAAAVDCGMSRGAWQFGRFRLDAGERSLLLDGVEVLLEPKAFDLLVFLIERAGRLARKSEIMDALWPDAVVGDVSLSRQVSSLRRALGDTRAEQRVIRTVSKCGYRFAAAVERAASVRLGGVRRAPRSEGRAHYLRGRYLWRRRTPRDLLAAVRCFDQALRCDPLFAAAHAGRADALGLLAGYGLGLEVFEEARAAAGRALARGGASAAAHTALGLIAQKSAGDWEEAECRYRAALDLRPRHVTALQRAGELLGLRGRFGEGLALLRRARDLDPVCAAVGADLAKICVYARRYDEALEAGRAVLEIEPAFPRAHLHLGVALLLSGRLAEGLAAVQTFAVEEDSAYALGMLAWAEATAGRPERAGRLARALSARDGFIAPFALALAHLALGKGEAACALLDRMFAEGHSLLGLGVSPLMDPLRGHAAFDRLIGRARLVA
jgi:DNA-binding winged helix-turn-helix (wHTH) protein/Tfp pilus assembly protein PilF